MITVHPNNNGTITVAEGSDVVLRCRATGNGTLNYQWKRVSGSLPSSAGDGMTSTLNIRNITVSDSGQYYCEVDIEGDKMSSMRVQVTVKSESLIINCITYVSRVYNSSLYYYKLLVLYLIHYIQGHPPLLIVLVISS